LHKKYNFFICTIYENDFTSKKYLGILKNFIDISPNQKKSGNNIDEREEDIPGKDSSLPVTDSAAQIKSTNTPISDSELKRLLNESLKK